MILLVCFIFLLGLCCSSGFFLVAASVGYSLVAVCGLLIMVASLVVEHGSQGAMALVVAAQSLRSCGSQALSPPTQTPSRPQAV